MPTYFPAARHASIARPSMNFTAGSRSSKASATSAESRSRPSVSWVMSFEPIEKPSKCSRNSSGTAAFEGISHIMITSSPFSPRTSPWLASRSITPLPSAGVRTKGIMSFTLVSPMSSRTYRSASHSIAKQSAKSSERYREAPR